MRLGHLLLVVAIVFGVCAQGWAVEPTVSFNGWTNTPGVKEGTVTIHAIDTTTPRPSLGYVDYLPLGYDANDHTKRWPVVFALLGVGEEGDGTNTGNQLYNKMTTHGPLFDIETLHYDFPCIVITPQAPHPAGWNNVTQLRAMIDYVKANYRVDTTRIYMTGLCDGCSGTLRFAATYPGVLAGIIPITSTYEQSTQAELDAVKHLPMWMVHCFSDQEFNRRTSINWMNRVTLADTGRASDLMATYPGYGGTVNHYACRMAADGKPNNTFGLHNTVSGTTVTNGSATVTLPANNMVANAGSFFTSLWGSGSDAAPFANVVFSSDSTNAIYNISGLTGNGLSMTLTGAYAGADSTANASVWTPVGLVETAYYQPGSGTWTWPAPTTVPSAAPPEQDPPAAGAYDNRVFTMFWQSDHTAGWVNTWKNGKVWDWLFTRAPNTSPATVTLSGLATTYTGSAHAVSVTTSPSGLAVDVTYDGLATLPINAGPHVVVATVNDPVFSGSASGTMTIAPAALGITLSNLSATWDGSAKPVGVATNPAGVAVSVAYAGGSVPVEPGSYAVSATSNDPNYTGSASATLTIAKATGSVALGQLSFTFDGSPKPISPTTIPASLALTTTYAGSATAPSAAGTYAVASTITDTHYQGSASGTLTIATATATVTLSGLSAVFNGSPHAVTATTNPPGLSTSITYDGSATAPTAAGAHAVVATVTDPSHSGSVSGTLVIAQATASVTIFNQSVTFDGSGHAASFTTSPTGLATTVTYSGSTPLPVNAATYPVIVTISDANYTGSGTANLVINPAPATVSLSGLSVTYNGGPRAAVVTTSPAGLATTVTYRGSPTVPLTVGSYAVVATVIGPNYAGSATGTLTIAPAPATIALSGLSTTYDGNGHAAVVSTTPANVATTVTYNGDSAVPVDAATYAVSVQIADPNFTGSAATGTLTIARAAAAVSFTDLNATFDGQPHEVTVVTAPSGLTTTTTYDGSASPPSAIGNHAVVATVTDPNYIGSGNATQTIATSPSTITLSGLAATYDGSPKSVSATTSPSGLAVDITYSGSATAPTEAGSYAVNATVNDPAHPGSASGTLVIARAVVTVTLGSLTAAYDGTPKAATASVAQPGLTPVITYNGATQVPTAAGSYSVVATVDTNDVTGSVSDTLVIAKAPLVIAGDAVTATVGAIVPPLGFHFVGLMPVDGDGSAVLLGTPALTTTATSASPAGTYPLTVSLSGVHADNYALTAEAGSVVLAPDASGGGGGGGGGVVSSGTGGGGGGGGGCGHGTAFAAVLMFGLLLMAYARLMVARPGARRD